MPVTLYLAVPCYNEEAVLPETSRRLRDKMTSLVQAGTVSPDSRVCFIDDGSKDGTWTSIAALHESDPLFMGVKLTRNRGHQNALLCGLMTLRSRADCVISMDADLQDDIDAIDAMLERFLDGCDVVYGVRSRRETDTAFKRITAEGFYHLMRLLGVEVVFNHADFRLMSRRALDGLAEFREVNLFLRGMVPLVGYRSDVVYYERAARFAGESKYSLRRMLSFAWEGITSLSVKPIQMILRLGVLFFAGGLAALVLCGIFGAPLGMLASGMVTLSGIQLAALGIVGEYVGKNYLETKARPRYLVETILDDRKESGQK